MNRDSQHAGADTGLNGRPIHTLIADDSAVALETLGSFLNMHDSFSVVGVAHNGAQAVRLAEALHPDLVLMDLQMPEMNGLEATKRLKAQTDAPCIIILTASDSALLRAAASAVGADGFVSKPDLFEQLPLLLHTLFCGSET